MATQPTGAMTRDQSVRMLTAAGAPFELVEQEVRGVPMRVYAKAPASMREVYTTSLAFDDRDFLVYDDTRWTYREFGERVARLAHHLVENLGVTTGDRVAIGMRNYPEWVVSFWAVQTIGAIGVPLNAWWTGPELEFALRDSTPTVALLDDERVERLGPGLADLVEHTLVVRARRSMPAFVRSLHGVIEHDVERTLPEVELDPDQASTIMYTSGTTGRPKGAVQTHRSHCTNLTNTAFAGAVAAAMAPAPAAADEPAAHTVSLQTFPFFHIGGLSGLYVSTAFGATLVLMYKWDPAEAVGLVVREQVNSVAGVPTVVRQLFDEFDRQGVVAESLGSISSGGAPVPPSLIDRIGERSGQAIRPANGYGLTETTSAVVMNSGPEYYAHPDSVGRPVPVADITIRDEFGVEVDDGVTGELWVRGPNVVDGYWNAPEATADAFTDGWFRTGDAAYVRDGLVYVVDRVKDVVLRGGENVYCAEVEAALHEFAEVADVAVIGLPHDVLGEEVAAVVEFMPGHTPPSGAEMRRRLADRLAAFKIPSRIFVTTGSVPRNATGKAMKKDLRSALVTGDPAYRDVDS